MNFHFRKLENAVQGHMSLYNSVFHQKLIAQLAERSGRIY